MMLEVFPANKKDDSQNPAIQLFGNRLFIDQSPVEFLVEFLLVASSPKRIGVDIEIDENSFLPTTQSLHGWKGEALFYAPKVRLNLKLFSFLGNSQLEQRHPVHREHYLELLKTFVSKISQPIEQDRKLNNIKSLENLFSGFQGAGLDRTWCAQVFMPVCRSFMTAEAVWNYTFTKNNAPDHWDNTLNGISSYYYLNRHRFMARGGEVLYLQVCNALRQKTSRIKEWLGHDQFGLLPDELHPDQLTNELNAVLKNCFENCPPALDELANFIDIGLDAETSVASDYDIGNKNNRHYLEAGFCADESWLEGYLLAVEIKRLCQADLDSLDRLGLLETACLMAVIRTLCFRSTKLLASNQGASKSVGEPGYFVAVTAYDEQNETIKNISQKTAKAIEHTIYQAIHDQRIKVKPPVAKSKGKSKSEADIRNDTNNKYGSKLFSKLCKAIGLIVPRRGGSGQRFVMSESVLRFLVLTIVPFGGHLTFDSFKKYVKARYGIIFDAQGFKEACQWAEFGAGADLSPNMDDWLLDMLATAGFLRPLSDSCALVTNPIDKLSQV